MVWQAFSQSWPAFALVVGLLLVGESAGADGLFEAIGSEEKTLHSSPGGHVQVPVFENDAAELFFTRHLGPAA